jgi:Holliday junction resolvase RusA-like endonuclease
VTTYAFQVRGIPQTQGSKRAFVIKGTNRAVVTESGGQKHKDWRSLVSLAAQEAVSGSPLLDGPVVVNLWFTLPKPASAPKKRRTWPIGARSGDVDKLARCVLDAFTGVVFRDDAQVKKLIVDKDYGDPGVYVQVGPLLADGVPATSEAI